MSKVLDLAGQVFGRLTVLRRAGSYVTAQGGTHATWWCRCECGVECVRVSSNIQRATSCGCAKQAVFAAREPEPMESRITRGVDRSGGPDACWLWTGARDRKGYGRMNKGARGTGSTSPHRVAYELTHGPIADGLFVCHRCDNPPCCNPAHLFLGTNTDNMRDCAEKGRHGSVTKPGALARGERHGNAKLTEELVRQIRSEWAAGGVRQRDLAARFGVDQAVVWSVIHRRTWAQVA